MQVLQLHEKDPIKKQLAKHTNQIKSYQIGSLVSIGFVTVRNQARKPTCLLVQKPVL